MWCYICVMCRMKISILVYFEKSSNSVKCTFVLLSNTRDDNEQICDRFDEQHCVRWLPNIITIKRVRYRVSVIDGIP